MGIICNRCHKESDSSNCIYSLRTRSVYECNDCFTNYDASLKSKYSNSEITVAKILTNMRERETKISELRRSSRILSKKMNNNSNNKILPCIS